VTHGQVIWPSNRKEAGKETLCFVADDTAAVSGSSVSSNGISSLSQRQQQPPSSATATPLSSKLMAAFYASPAPSDTNETFYDARVQHYDLYLILKGSWSCAKIPEWFSEDSKGGRGVLERDLSLILFQSGIQRLWSYEAIIEDYSEHIFRMSWQNLEDSDILMILIGRFCKDTAKIRSGIFGVALKRYN